MPKDSHDAGLLPDFIVIGAMKCGTTSLYRYLAAHPGIEMSRDKETDFFVAEKNWSRGLDWYRGQFSIPGLKHGEASPNYTKSRDFPGVPARIAATCPDARLIYIVRDPVARAQSQFRHSYILGALDPDMASFAGSHEYEHILDASRYALQAEVFLDHFPREQLLVVDFDELVADPQRVLDAVAAHIGVASHPVVATGAQNDSTQLSRVPAPVLRFAQSRLGRSVAGLVGRETRDRIRGALARGKTRKPPAFSPELVERMRADLAPDAARFRVLSGKAFADWSV